MDICTWRIIIVAQYDKILGTTEPWLTLYRISLAFKHSNFNYLALFLRILTSVSFLFLHRNETFILRLTDYYFTRYFINNKTVCLVNGAEAVDLNGLCVRTMIMKIPSVTLAWRTVTSNDNIYRRDKINWGLQWKSGRNSLHA